MEDILNDELLDRVMDIIGEDEKFDYVNIQDKVDLMNVCYNYLKESVDGADIKCALNEPFKSMGYISMNGKNIKFNSSLSMLAVVLAASNVDVYPKTDGTITIDFGFHGIARKK